MSLLKKKGMREAEMPSGSLADIAFLLLIFFLLSTTIDMDKGIGIVLPAEGGEIKMSSQNITNILIDARGSILMDDKEVEMHEIKGIVENLQMQNPKMVFSVKAHPRTKYKVYVEVLDQLKQAKTRVISIAE
ncbi:MAG TPA: biopolymer transporter ExbD [Candidatus Marinimicrobia bacterium]|nr:biopolymer transporter ExbD [Candidatus Neomarinimicrobiota bacterium]